MTGRSLLEAREEELLEEDKALGLVDETGIRTVDLAQKLKNRVNNKRARKARRQQRKRKKG